MENQNIKSAIFDEKNAIMVDEAKISKKKQKKLFDFKDIK